MSSFEFKYLTDTRFTDVMDSVRIKAENEAYQHMELAESLKNEVYDPLKEEI